jgi:hypothetical protein
MDTVVKVLVIVLLVFSNTSVSGSRALAITDCNGDKCRYLPIVARSKPVTILNTTVAYGRGFTFAVRGELQNTSTDAIKDVVLQGAVLIGNSSLPIVVTATTSFEPVLPGQIAPFQTSNRGYSGLSVLISDTMEVVSYVTVTETNLSSPIVVLNQPVSQSGLKSVVVTVTNSQTVPLTNIAVYAWANTTDLDQHYPAISAISSLQPNQTVTRELRISYDFYDMGFSFDQARATAIGTIGP